MAVRSWFLDFGCYRFAKEINPEVKHLEKKQTTNIVRTTQQTSGVNV